MCDLDKKNLILEWLKEWKNDCSRVGSKMEFVYLRAIKSLRETKDNINSGADCQKLKYFGEKICKRIDDHLKKYYKENHLNVDSSTKQDDCQKNDDSSQEMINLQLSQKCDDSSKFKKKSKTKQYVPKYRSGGYAFLIALLKAEQAGLSYLSKNDLIQRAQPFCNEPITVPKQGSYYTTWNSMTTLVKHNYVEVEKHRYSTYRLTQAGTEIANKIITYDKDDLKAIENKTIDNNSNIDEKIILDTEAENTRDEILSSQIEKFSLAPGTFDIILIIDSREQHSLTNNEFKKTAILAEFLNRNIKCQMMKLPVGDFAWLAKEKKIEENFEIFSSSQETKKELILDYIIERKRYDDLASSIKGGRWGEQKYRLLNCGLRKPIYLIEDFGVHRKSESLYQSMVQAISDAQIIDGLIIKQTDNYSETIDYLSTMTKYLEAYYKEKTLFSCTKKELLLKKVDNNHFMTFKEFSLNSDKISNFTSTEMFIKHLLKIRGISVIKAKSIVQYYSTVALLLEAYEMCENEKAKESLLSEIPFGQFEKKLGMTLSKKIYKYYTYECLK